MAGPYERLRTGANTLDSDDHASLKLLFLLFADFLFPDQTTNGDAVDRDI